MVLKGFNNTSIFTPSAVAPWLCLCISLALDCSGDRSRVSSHHHCGIHVSSHSSLHPSESAYFWRSSLFWCTNRLVLQHLWCISMKLRSGKYKGHRVTRLFPPTSVTHTLTQHMWQSRVKLEHHLGQFQITVVIKALGASPHHVRVWAQSIASTSSYTYWSALTSGHYIEYAYACSTINITFQCSVSPVVQWLQIWVKHKQLEGSFI